MSGFTTKLLSSSSENSSLKTLGPTDEILTSFLVGPLSSLMNVEIDMFGVLDTLIPYSYVRVRRLYLDYN